MQDFHYLFLTIQSLGSGQLAPWIAPLAKGFWTYPREKVGRSPNFTLVLWIPLFVVAVKLSCFCVKRVSQCASLSVHICFVDCEAARATTNVHSKNGIQRNLVS